MLARFINKIIGIIFRSLKKWSLFPPEPDSWDTEKRILLVCIAGLGDNLLCTPVARAIKKSFPDSYLAFMAHRKRQDVLANIPTLDEIIPYHKGIFSFFQLAHQLRKRRFNRVLIFHSTHGDLLPLCYMSRAHRIIGFREKNPLNFLLTETIPHDLNIHTIQDRLRLAENIGAHSDDYKMDWQILPKEREEAENLFKQHNLIGQPKVIGFQLGTGPIRRRWPLEYYVELGQMIANRFGVYPILLGSENEKPLLKKAHFLMGEKSPILITDLRICGAIIEKLDLMIAPNTGPMHIAIALNIPLISLFGSATHHVYGPFPASLTQVVMCKNDVLGESSVEGMKLIKPSEVMQKVEEIFSLTIEERGISKTN